MRLLLQYPMMNIQTVSDTEQILIQIKNLLDQFPWVVQNNSEIVFSNEQAQSHSIEHIHRLSFLTGKMCSLFQLIQLQAKFEPEVLPYFLLQPKAPAVFDITLEETKQIVHLIYKTKTPAHQTIYYRELLQKSLLLSDIEHFLPSNALPTNSSLDDLALQLYTEGKEGAAIIAF